MASTALKVRVGIFVIVGIVLAVGAVIGLVTWLGKRDVTTYVTYISESTSGLDPDAPVKYKGVKVGRVSDINVAPDGIHVEVLMEVDSSFRMKQDYTARVEYAGITGLRYVEIETIQEGKEPRRIELSFKPRYPVIPSRTSDLEQLGDQLTKTLRNLNQLDVKAVSDKSTKLMDNLNTILAQLDNAKIAGTIDNLEVTIKSLNELIADLEAKTLSEKMNVFLDEGILLSRNLNALTFELQNLAEADDVMRATADTVKELNQTLKQSPSTMLFSQPPQPRLIKGDKQ